MKNLKDQIVELLAEMELNYDFDEELEVFNLQIRMENTDVNIRFTYDEENLCLYNVSSLMSSLPQDGITAVLYKINEIHNRSFSQAHLYIDNDDNKLYAQAVIDIPENRVIDKDIFGFFIFSAADLLNDNFNDIMNAAYGRNEAENTDVIKEE